jgi:hypothetical protein
MAGWAGRIRVQNFEWEGGETQHRPHNNQPLTSPRVVAIVPGLLLLYCGWEASLEATEISWLRCLSLGRLVVVFYVCWAQARSVCVCVVLVSQRSLPESKSFDSVTLPPITI